MLEKGIHANNFNNILNLSSMKQWYCQLLPFLFYNQVMHLINDKRNIHVFQSSGDAAMAVRQHLNNAHIETYSIRLMLFLIKETHMLSY